MAKWEIFERRREAERRVERAAKKLAEAKKANAARLAEKKRQEKDRSQKVAAERAARQREQEEQQREAAVPEGGIRVNVIDGRNYGVQITVPKEGVRAHVLMATATQRMGLQGKKVVFVHNGVELKEDDPIEKYELEDLDTIDVKRKWW